MKYLDLPEKKREKRKEYQRHISTATERKKEQNRKNDDQRTRQTRGE